MTNRTLFNEIALKDVMKLNDLVINNRTETKEFEDAVNTLSNSLGMLGMAIAIGRKDVNKESRGKQVQTYKPYFSLFQGK